jgi:hypothetical protein
MKNSRLGCFTASGLISTILTILILAGFYIVQGGILFSPGPLNAKSGPSLGGVTSHAEIAGQCNLCHTPFWGNATMADRCVVCHTDVAAQWRNPSTLHGVLRKNEPEMTCRTCHPDHRGANASLTDMSNANFPHDSLGYSLLAHQPRSNGSQIGCPDCHAQNYIAPFDQSVCATCHSKIDPVFTQTHLLAFGNDCLACHDGVDSYGHNFDHNKQKFPLTGKHADTLCSSCHLNARNLTDLRSAPQDCYSCHAKDDNHQGRFGTNCGICHTTTGWTPASFDHNLAAFKLDGQHINVACENCHINNVFKGTPTGCYSCHKKDDIHKGHYGTNCAACHTTAGWLPANVDHNLFSFKLTGKHITVACEGCHINGLFKGTPSGCYSCHQKDDNHKGRFGKDCGACHSTNGWKPATFDHNLSGFPLTGAHTALNCTQCHASGNFGGLSPSCAACHAEPSVHAGMFGTDCVQCHNTSNWNASFNHPGGCDGNCANHAGASCRTCHPVNYSTATCTACHGSNNPGRGDGGGGGGD